MTSENHNLDDQPTLTLIQQIKDDLFDPKILDRERRQQCIEPLTGEGLSEAAIAQFLKVSTKTISRDMQAIRERNALIPNVNLVKQVVGELLQYARIHRAYLMRLARSKDASVSEKTQAEYSAWLVTNQCVERLQSLGYAPLRPQEIVGDIFHHLNDGNEESLVEVQKIIVELEMVAKDSRAGNEGLLAETQKLKQRLEKAEIANEAAKLIEKQKEDNQKKEDENVQ